jgi:hypothetical protein
MVFENSPMAEHGGRLPGSQLTILEMALMLARMLMKQRRYDAEEARKAYVSWLNSALSTVAALFQAGFAGGLTMKVKRMVP